MRVHTKFHTYSMKDMTGKVVVFFYHQDGSPVKDLNDNYRTTDGNVSCSDKFSPTYENSLYEDFKVFIPYSEIHMLPGEHSYKCYAAVYSNSLGKYISNSDWTYFTGTGVKEVQKIFPEGKSFSFASDDGNNLFITFVINNNNEQQATVWVDYSRTELYHWDYNTSDGLGFNGYDLKPVQEIIGYDFFGNPIKSFFSGKYTTTRNDNSFILQADYSSLVLNGKYYKRVETKKYYGVEIITVAETITTIQEVRQVLHQAQHIKPVQNVMVAVIAHFVMEEATPSTAIQDTTTNALVALETEDASCAVVAVTYRPTIHT